MIHQAPKILRRLQLEHLEARLNLAGDIGSADACPFIVADDDASRAAHAVNCFATDLYEQLQREDGNVVFSPLSISTALAMTYSGAASETAAEMERVLHLGDTPGIHESFQALLAALDREDGQFEPELVNSLWTQAGFPFLPSFVEGVSENYAGYALDVDYIADPEGARHTINDWVSERTANRINELLPQGTINELTRLVLTNTIYYKADWANPFSEFLTAERPFFKEDGSQVDVMTMSNEEVFLSYTEHGGFQVLELPYALAPPDSRFVGGIEPGSTSMILLLPQDGFAADDLTPQTLADVGQWLDSEPEPRAVDVFLPKFKATVATDLKPVLAGMGAEQMFDPHEADFSNLTEATNFHVTDVLHEAFLEIDEQGTEATGATAVVAGILCFAKGTPVQTPSGAMPIETLTEGDYVLSRNEHDPRAPVEQKEIMELFENEAEIINLKVAGQIIRTTSEHPFFVKDRGWTPAVELQEGDALAADLSSWVEVEEVVATGEVETVYNFRVAQHHTYFVGSQEWGFHLWTHNACGGPPPETVEFRADHPFHFLIRDNLTSAVLFMGRIEDPLQESNSLSPTFEENETSGDRIPGDADGDGRVGFADFLILSHNFGKNEDAVFAEGDFDGNSTVDFRDFLVLQENFGSAREVVA